MNKMNRAVKIGIKIFGLIAFLIGFYFLESIIFLLIFGEGNQAGSLMSEPSTKLLMLLLPLFLVIYIALKTFSRK